MKSMKTKFVSLILVVGFILPVNANAFFFKSMVEGMTSVANNMVDSSTQISSEMLDLFGALADDIGEMADRILVMADKIGEMADRIVATEQLMADMMVQLAQINNNTAGMLTGNGGTTSPLPTLIISSANGETLTPGQAPVFTPSHEAPEYLAYVSSTLAISSTTTAILVHSNEELADKWSELETLSKNGKIYLAVRTIDGANISSLSNVLTYHTFY